MKTSKVSYIIIYASLFILISLINVSYSKSQNIYDDFEENNFVGNMGGGYMQSEKYMTNDEFIHKNKVLEYACLDENYLPKNKEGKIHMISASEKQKVESFKHGKCLPVIIVPGFLGTKLEFKITNCNLFSKHHPEILNACKWDNCNQKQLKKFTLWVNMDIDPSEILSYIMGGQMSGNKNNKQKKVHIPKLIKSITIEDGQPIEYEINEGCLGILLRMYYKENINNSDNELTDNKSKHKFYSVEKLKGAELTVQSTTRAECGADNVSNLLGNIFSTSNTFKGFHNLNNHLVKMGYVKGLNLFNVPYDFRLNIDNLIYQLKKAVRISYQINKKKALIISHSYGGLISLKLSGYYKESELIKHIVFIGSPFLGSTVGTMNVLAKYSQLKIEKKISYLGINGVVKTDMDKTSIELINSSFPSLHFFPKQALNDEVDAIIKAISEVENIIENKFKANIENYKMTNRIQKVFNSHIENSPYKPFLEQFYKIFPKPYKFCFSIPSKNKENSYNGICKINMKDYTEKPLFKFNEKEIILKNILKEENFNHVYDLLNLFFDKSIDLLNKFSAKDYYLEKDKYLRYLINNQEKDLFKEFKRNENIEYTFIYANHLKTIEYAEFDNQKSNVLRKNLKFTHGDSTINSFSQIYPGLRWFVSDIGKSLNESQVNFNSNGKLNFVEYCAQKADDGDQELKVLDETNQYDSGLINSQNEDLDKSPRDIIKNNNYDNSKKVQHVALKCDCMTNTNLDPEESCNHAGIINDSHLINFISDVILGSKNNIYRSEDFYELYISEFTEKMKCGNLFNK